jgi:hypothetical protein
MCKPNRCDDIRTIMIEAGAILFVVVVSLGIYLFSWIGAREFSKANATNQLDVLRQHRETLLQKRVRGQQEGWDSEMIRQLEYRLDDVEHEIARAVSGQ